MGMGGLNRSQINSILTVADEYRKMNLKAANKKSP
ncbi:MAG: hypothetical protein RUMPE_01202 [Eubacteriales bacterium SKADARSKE-1]|nr:hypothetical protein [Eubacteriales bacterium SKADARSKE-1]MDQ5984166.1 hypothetical protein [Eubacteriales bacterium SKADARSKE-1]